MSRSTPPALTSAPGRAHMPTTSLHLQCPSVEPLLWGLGFLVASASVVVVRACPRALRR